MCQNAYDSDRWMLLLVHYVIHYGDDQLREHLQNEIWVIVLSGVGHYH